MIRRSKRIVSESSSDPDRAWNAVRGGRAVILTSYRRDGSAVATPVGYGIAGGRLYFMTPPGTYKVRRLARDPRCEVAAGTLRGKVLGPACPGDAHPVHGAAAEDAIKLITAHNRLAWFFLLRRARRRNQSWLVFEVSPRRA